MSRHFASNRGEGAIWRRYEDIECATLNTRYCSISRCRLEGYPRATLEDPLATLLYQNIGFAGRPAFTEFSAQIRSAHVILGERHEAIEITR